MIKKFLQLICIASLILISFSVDANSETTTNQETQTKNENQTENIDISSMLEMTDKEIEKILSCIEIITHKLKSESQILNAVVQSLSSKVSADIASQKILADLLDKCYSSIDEKTVEFIFKDLVYQEALIDEYYRFAELDYTKYTTYEQIDFQISPEIQILFKKLELARNDYIKYTKTRQEQLKNEFFIFGFSLKNIPKKVYLLFAFVFISIFILGIVLLLSKVINNEKKAAKKKEKKK